MNTPKNKFGNIVLGPLLNEDAIFLQAIILMTNPKVIVEFGYFWGDSSRAMLAIMDSESILHSFDNMKTANIVDKRFVFHNKSQDEIEGIENIDFVFLDASHDFELNKKTFEKLIQYLSPKAIIAVHDTGNWIGGNVFNYDGGYLKEDGTYCHCPSEQRFVDWIEEMHPDFQQIHFHSTRQVRHGITLLQKYTKLQ